MTPEELLKLNNLIESFNKLNGNFYSLSDLFYRSNQTDKFLFNRPILLSEGGIGYDDLRIVPTAFDFVGGSDPTLVDYQPTGSGATTKLYEFAKNDIAYFVVQLPHNYKEGTDLRVHIHWTPASRGNEENGNTVGWKVLYTWTDINGTFPAMSTADLSDACDGTDDKHQMTPSVAISGAGKKISSMLICQVTRTDTGTDDTWSGSTTGQLPLILEVDFHYQIDSIGSKSIIAK